MSWRRAGSPVIVCCPPVLVTIPRLQHGSLTLAPCFVRQQNVRQIRIWFAVTLQRTWQWMEKLSRRPSLAEAWRHTDGDGGKTGKCNYWQWADCDWQWPRSGLVTSHHRFPACDREVSWTCHAWQLVMGLCNTLIDSFRLPTVNIYWWHSHEFLIPSDPVSSNSVLRSQCTRCFLQSSSFCPGAAKNRPSLLIVHLVIAKQKYGSVFTQIRYTTRHSAIVNGLPPTFLVLLKPETWWHLNFSRNFTFKSEFFNQVLTFVFAFGGYLL